MSMPTEAEITSAIPTIKDLNLLKTCGQKSVYLADDQRFGTAVLKIIINQAANERTKREIEVAVAGKIPFVPEIYAHGEIAYSSGKNYYLIERYVDGSSLEDFYISGKRFSFPECALLLETLLFLAVECEKIHLVHRDLKPGNIIFDSHGKFWIIDFGIARHLDLPSITGSADAFGPHTAGYAPPEQFRNLKNDVDIRADLFSIGVVLYEALTGSNPFRDGARSALEVLYRTEKIVPAPPIIDEDTSGLLAQFVVVLMSRFISRRPKTAVEAQNWYLSLKPTLKM